MKKVLTLLCSAALLSGMTATPIHAHYLDPVEDAYSECISIYSYDYDPSYYVLYDINKDGTPELMIFTGEFLAEQMWTAYTYDYSNNRVSYLGTIHHSTLCSYPNGKGMLSFFAIQGGEWVDLITIDNNDLNDTQLMYKYCPDDYDEIGALYPGSEELPEAPTYDLNYLYNYFASAKEYANRSSAASAPKKTSKIAGHIYNTDIRTFIDDVEIPCYAADGKCLVVAEDLRNYGFQVDWNAATRTLELSYFRMTEDPPVGMAIPAKQKAGSIFCDYFNTDIKVKYANTYIKCYPINGYVLIPIEDVLFTETYNNDLRRLDLLMGVG